MKLPLVGARRGRGPAQRLTFAHRAKRFAIFVIVLAGLVGIGALVMLGGQRADGFIRRSDFFKIRSVKLSPVSADVERRIDVLVDQIRHEQNDNLFLLDADLARERIEALPRVRSASLRKEYPETLRITVQEREPLVVANVEELFWMDEQGYLLDRATPAEIAESGSPILTGIRGSAYSGGSRVKQEGLAEALRAIRYLRRADPAMSAAFAEWHIGPENTISAVLREGVEVRFGEGDPLELMSKLAAVIEAKPDLGRYRTVDLRFEGQVICF